MKAISKVEAFLDAYASKAQLLLRIGLAIVFLYAAASSFMTPTDWVGFLPEFVRVLFPATAVLAVFSVIEIILAAWLLSGVYIRLAGAVAAVMLLGIVASNVTLLPISFRDIGLAFMALALVLMKEDTPKESI